MSSRASKVGLPSESAQQAVMEVDSRTEEAPLEGTCVRVLAAVLLLSFEQWTSNASFFYLLRVLSVCSHR